MRAYEIAIESGVKLFVFSNLDYALKKGGFNTKFRCAHEDGKGRVAGIYSAADCFLLARLIYILFFFFL